ncbi:MAG: HAMP domain-containing histidine kinase [Clostridiales bacterium]|nr:HAMP domain-containing histidine kinase [Clostridiales bacterium]
MNENKPWKESGQYQNRISIKLLKRFGLILLVYIIVAFFAFLFGKVVLSRKIWYKTDFLYPFLHYIDENSVIVVVLVCLIGAIILGCFYIFQVLGYLDKMLYASGKMTKEPENVIILPNVLKDVQDDMNAIRERNNRNIQLAKEAEQRKNDLIVYLAHDLNTPLTSVIGYLTLLVEEEELSDKLRKKYTGIALSKAERLEDLINEFFDITRFNLTTMALDKEAIHLSRMLEQIASEFLPIMDEKKLTWDMHVEKDIFFLGDADKMERVVDNLIRNAINYSYPETAIHLSLTQRGKEISLLVSNKGKNIAKEKLVHIFEQFYRLDSSRATNTGGAGLGLAIAKEIVELHQGSITAESRDESITFRVNLPGE